MKSFVTFVGVCAIGSAAWKLAKFIGTGWWASLMILNHLQSIDPDNARKIFNDMVEDGQKQLFHPNSEEKEAKAEA